MSPIPLSRSPLNKTLLILACLALLLPAGGCRRDQVSTTPIPVADEAPPEAQPDIPSDGSPGDHVMSMQYGGIPRTYVVHIPPGLDATRPAALVLAFHGISLDAAEMMRISKLSELSDREGFIVVYPEGSGTTRSWNGGHCCGTAARDAVDDVGFVRAIITELTASLPVDPQRIHATGFSNGAIFTYRLMCELSDQIASFAPVSATPAELDLQVCDPGRPVALMHFHGTADEPNPYDGGTLPSGFYFLSVDAVIRYWVEKNGCHPDPQREQSGSIVHDVYEACISGSAVELYTINGGLHAWPGGEMVNLNMGAPNMEIDASALMWAFFSSHPLP